MRKAEDLVDWGRLYYKLMVIHDVYELEDLADVLKEAGFTRSPQALGFYLRGKRKPPADFFDYSRRAMGWSQEMYNLLLYTHHSSLEDEATPYQKEQMKVFEEMLFKRQAEGTLNSGVAAVH